MAARRLWITIVLERFRDSLVPPTLQNLGAAGVSAGKLPHLMVRRVGVGRYRGTSRAG